MTELCFIVNLVKLWVLSMMYSICTSLHGRAKCAVDTHSGDSSDC